MLYVYGIIIIIIYSEPLNNELNSLREITGYRFPCYSIFSLFDLNFSVRQNEKSRPGSLHNIISENAFPLNYRSFFVLEPSNDKLKEN